MINAGYETARQRKTDAGYGTGACGETDYRTQAIDAGGKSDFDGKIDARGKMSAHGKMDAHRKIKARGETDGEMDARESRWKCGEKPPEGQANARA